MSETYDSLDNCLDAARMQSNDLFSVASLVRGQPERKKQKTVDLKPVTFVRFNSRIGKANQLHSSVY